MVEISVVIPTIKQKEEIDCIRYLRNLEFNDYEIIIRRDEGISKARNEGIKNASAEKIVFLDDDSRPRKGFLKEACDSLEEHDVVAGKVVQPKDTIFDYLYLPWYDQGDSPKYTNMIAGCNFGARKKVFEEVGYFNERFRLGHEETEWVRRFCKNQKVYYNPKMVVKHYYATSLTQYWKKRYLWGKADTVWWNVDNVPWVDRLNKTIKAIPARLDFRKSFFITGNMGLIMQTLGRLKGLACEKTADHK